MASASSASKTRHLHLVRAAQSAGEAFAPPASDDTPIERGIRTSLMWLGVGLFAAIGLVFAF
ncbi:hypothetical protein [Salinarimonas soli]|uniref:Uncharacterized protein n=1 Tax=Salinarimonas soli TaxID=1638099 RepID=A0A5B2V8J2_9HYPH|nr:hypothetical protein [Salinarimonas soli]KAA2235291.1 hypothetical protein F0L46_19935 [Salinarimonas soli]